MLVLLPAELGVPLVSGATQLLQVTGLCVCAWGGDEGEWVGGCARVCVYVCVYHGN